MMNFALKSMNCVFKMMNLQLAAQPGVVVAWESLAKVLERSVFNGRILICC